MMIAVPYFTEACTDPARNLSAYAVSKNYHAYFDFLFNELMPLLKERFPDRKFACFADHSPIAEVEAAARAGLGCIGENHLLITEKYASYVFLGSLITDESLPAEIHPIRHCEGCGLCQKACPMTECGVCLSALTQKKGALSAEETEILLRHGSVWGCDICQEVCPHTKRALQSRSIFSTIPYFSEDSITHLTLEILDGMSEETFLERAFSWRGRETVRRNLLLLNRKGDTQC
ncbi:MAG: hypothetical protein IKJ35_06185 [Clostridia bacterium]|nr:hypothetical protein [Clostridia bacterium]